MHTDVGVIIARFQTPDLHAGHHFLLNYVIGHHTNTLVLIGDPPLPLKQRNPLDYEARAVMVSRSFPDVVVGRLEDCSSDEIWSQRVDELINTYFPSKPAILYGSRDSFIPHYSGRHKCEIVPPPENLKHLTATDLREGIGVLGTRDFRIGMIYASKLPFPTSYQVADVAVIDETHKTILLGQKAGDGDKYRFIGGFVDPTDVSLERAAKREVTEETCGLETADYVYLGSARINDWRYEGCQDKVMTAFFKAKYIFGHPKASDDIERLAWIPLGDLDKVLIKEHLPLAKLLLADLYHPPVGYVGML